MRIIPSHSAVSRTASTRLNTNEPHFSYTPQCKPRWLTKPLAWLGAAVDALLPNHCALCSSKAKGLLCSPCANELPPIAHSCTRCALPLPQTELCAECLKTPPSFDSIVAAYEYAYPLDHLVLQFKHNNHPHIGRKLAEKLALTICHTIEQTIEHKTPSPKPLSPMQHAATPPDIIACVPLHWRRRLQRGFNQAEIIAKHLHAHTSAQTTQYLPQLLTKLNHTQSQQNLSRKQRLKNLRQSFAVAPKLLTEVKGKHIAVVDDVVTTGATAEVIANLLKEAGASRVDIWALARTPKHL